MACDPAVLIEQAKCIQRCIPSGMMSSVNTALLCQILNGGGGSGGFPASLLVGLIHYWKMEELSGNNRIDSVGSSNLLETGGAVASAAGVHGNGAQSVASSYFENSPFVVSTPWSFSFWVKFTTFIGGSDIAEVSASGSTGPYFTSDGAGVMIVGNGTDGTVITQSIGAIGIWHLVVFTVLANGTYSLSIDNSAFSTAVAPTPPAATFLINVLASQTNGGATLQGIIDEVALWSRPLSQSDVTVLWNGGVGTFL